MNDDHSGIEIGDKVFMGRDIIHVAIWPKEGTHFYTKFYQDGFL